MGLKLHGPLSEYFSKIRRIGVASVTLAHPFMAPSLLPALEVIGGGQISDKDNMTGASKLHKDGMHLEVLKFIKNGLEP